MQSEKFLKKKRQNEKFTDYNEKREFNPSQKEFQFLKDECEKEKEPIDLTRETNQTTEIPTEKFKIKTIIPILANDSQIFTKKPQDFIYTITANKQDKDQIALKRYEEISKAFQNFFDDPSTMKKMRSREIEAIMGYYTYMHLKTLPKETDPQIRAYNERISKIIPLIKDLVKKPELVKMYLSQKAYSQYVKFMQSRQGEFRLYHAGDTKLIIYFKDKELRYKLI